MNKYKNVSKLTLVCAFLIISVFNLKPYTFAKENNVATTTPINTSQTQINAKVTSVDLNSDNLEYFEDQDLFVATGHPEITVQDQGVKLSADKITYNKTSQIITAEGNVKITKNGQILYGDYTKVDLTKESVLIDKPSSKYNNITISAKTGNIHSNDFEALHGKAVVNDSNLRLSNIPNTVNYLIPKNDTTTSKSNNHASYKIVSKEILIKSYPNKNIIKVKNASVLLGKVKVLTIPTLEFATGKDKQNVETNLPEIGGERALGNYIAYGYTLYIPNGSTLKVAPLFAYSSDGVGVGGFGRYMSDNNRTEVMYSTLYDKLLFRGEQNAFLPNTKIVYGSNSYIEDGILGQRLSKYIVDVVNEKTYDLKDTNMNLTLRGSAGYAKDYYKDFGTGRFKIQSNLISKKPIWNYKRLLELRLVSRGDVTVYGNGDIFGLISIGPNVTSNLGPLTVSTTYLQGGIHGQSPFLFDRYVYGKNNLQFQTNCKLSKYLDLGYLGYYNLTKDNWEKKLITENQFFVKAGPEDFKFYLAYDTVRKRSLFGIDLAVGTDTGIEFDRLKATKIDKDKNRL